MNLNPWFIGFLLLIGALGYFSRYIPQMGEDNAIEELAENVLKDNLGYDIDFSPASPENKK